MTIVQLHINGQDFNPVQHGTETLMIPCDAGAGGLADQGVATNPDNFSQYWNPAKYVFTESRASIGESSRVWFRKPYNDFYKLNTTGHFNFWRNSISFSVNYFSLGQVKLGEDEIAMTLHPWELSADIAYAIRVTDWFSLAATTRYIRSNVTYDYTSESKPANAFCFDLSAYWKFKKKLVDINVGVITKNIGPKISYGDDDNKEFLPACLSLGAGVDFHPHRYHHLGFYMQFNKLLVPTFPKQKSDESAEDYLERVQRQYYDMPAIKGMFKSFADAPGGFKEEMQEIDVSLGLEYFMFNRVAFRSGYHQEAENKGNRKYFTFGLGLRFKPIDLNISYLHSTSKSCPLDRTLTLDFALKLPYINKKETN